MKHLTLVRHAKSDWKNAQLKDFDRPGWRSGSPSSTCMSTC